MADEWFALKRSKVPTKRPAEGEVAFFFEARTGLLRYVDSAGAIATVGPRGRRVLHLDTAAGTAVTGTVTETSVATYAFGAADLLPARVIEYEGLVHAHSTTGTTTLTVRVRFGPNADETTNTEIALGTATDVATGAAVTVRGKIHIHASDRMVHTVLMDNPPAATGVPNPESFFYIFTSAASTPYYLDITAKWSAADANSARSECWTVWEDAA